MTNNTYKKTFFTAAAILTALNISVIACDSWVAMPDATADGIMIMGKNSDVASYECEPFVRWEGFWFSALWF